MARGDKVQSGFSFKDSDDQIILTLFDESINLVTLH